MQYGFCYCNNTVLFLFKPSHKKRPENNHEDYKSINRVIGLVMQAWEKYTAFMLLFLITLP